jgi:L-iditol 2-dehydrogenase
MRAARLFNIGDIRVVDMPIPEIKENEVLLKVGAVGVCGSDIPRVMSSGAHHMPITIGHEFAGTVVKVGSRAVGWAEGDRATVAPLMPCYKCFWCLQGKYHMCDDYDYFGSRCDGAIAEYVPVPVANLIRLPDNVSMEEAAQCDPSATALHALWRTHITAGDIVVVYGVGAIGFYAVQWARIMGAKEIIAVDVYDDKLELATKLGATRTINGRQEDPVAKIKQFTDGHLANVTLEFAASQRTELNAIESTRKSGTVIFVGISHDKLELPEELVSRIMRNEINVTGSWNSNSMPFPGGEWTLSVDYMANGLLQAKPIISHHFGIEEAPRVFPMLYERKVSFNKVLFIPA